MNISDKALELIIRDVLSGMEELAIGQGYGACLENMEILAVEPAEGPASAAPVASASHPPQEAVVLTFPGLKKTA
ncbi:MAG TPA: hypothetical protein VIQ75_10575 [Gammaproteobacteria bacterium]